MRKNNVNILTQAAIIAALYVILTYFTNMVGLANGPIQVRFSEALCILPAFTVAAVPGLFIGCLIANLLTGAVIWDVLFGSVATLIGALGTYWLRKHNICMVIPPILANAFIMPLILQYGYGYHWAYQGIDISFWYFAVTVGIGELISVGVMGTMLRKLLLPYRNEIFKNE